jgi:hypothetical protein
LAALRAARKSGGDAVLDDVNVVGADSTGG